MAATIAFGGSRAGSSWSIPNYIAVRIHLVCAQFNILYFVFRIMAESRLFRVSASAAMLVLLRGLVSKHLTDASISAP